MRLAEDEVDGFRFFDLEGGEVHIYLPQPNGGAQRQRRVWRKKPEKKVRLLASAASSQRRQPLSAAATGWARAIGHLPPVLDGCVLCKRFLVGNTMDFKSSHPRSLNSLGVKT